MPKPSYRELEKRIDTLENELDALRGVEIRFQALFENSPIGVAYHRMIYSKDGQPIDFYYLAANNNFKEFTGQDPTGRLVTEVFPGIENDPDFDWIGTCGKVARTGDPTRFQKYLPPVDRWYDIQVFQEKPDHFVVSFLEVTEQKKTEMALHQSNKLDAIGQLAGGIAHDFNNMLGGIIGATEMLGHYLPEKAKPKEFHKIILDSAIRAADLTRQLLTFSRHYDPTSTGVDIHGIIGDTAILLNNTIDRRINIQLDLTAETSTVVGDPSQLQSIFLNLGINGAQAMPDGGTLTIQTRVVEFDPAYCHATTFDLKPGSYLNIEIRDSGCGISSEHIDKIFDPFFTTKAQGKGTGLGLSSAYGAIVQHKGEISVYSELGQGTVFQIYFPILDSDDVIQKTVFKVKRGTGTILIVDDEEVMRLTAKAILEDLGYDVVLAKNGQQALELFRQDSESFHLVLLDMIMPIMNGRDCFLELKKLAPNIPVVLSSGFSREKDLKTLKDYGLNGFIRKPYLSASLSQVIHDALN